MAANLGTTSGMDVAATTLRTVGRKRTILGIDFFTGSVADAICTLRGGGLLVVPAAPALELIDRDLAYRDALLDADLVLPDSGLMVLAWNYLEHDSLTRLSGLAYLTYLLQEADVRRPGNTLWIMASPSSGLIHRRWLEQQGISADGESVYVAPIYESVITDVCLLEVIQRLRPQHIVITVGGGTQERLGLYLKKNLDYLPSIHCVGAALAFLTGDQVRIPAWADRLYLGWLLRCLWQPARYVPRYWRARRLLPLLRRYRSALPPLQPVAV